MQLANDLLMSLGRQLHICLDERKRDGSQVRRKESARCSPIDSLDGLLAIRGRVGNGVDHCVATTAGRPSKVANPIRLISAAILCRELFEMGNGLSES